MNLVLVEVYNLARASCNNTDDTYKRGLGVEQKKNILERRSERVVIAIRMHD